MRQLQAEKRRSVKPKQAVFLSFDDDRLAGIESGQLSLLLEEYYRRFPELRGRETVSWYLDEIQFVPGWDRFVRRIMDTEKVEIVVSGSSARILSREVHTSLRGRGMETVIRPFSFREFLRHRNEEPEADPRQWTQPERSLVEKRFLEFLTEGGFPEAQGLTSPPRFELLQGYVDAVIFRDIVERHGITQLAALRWVLRYCLRNPAGLVSVHRLHKDLQSQGLGVSKDLMYAMFGYLMDSFLLTAVRLASESERQRNSNPMKIYPADPGLIGAYDTSGRSNRGHALETAVLNEIERRHGDVGYVKTPDGREVDFLVRYPAGPAELIQVCADISDGNTRTRELRALETAPMAGLSSNARKRLLVTTLDQALSYPGGEIDILPAYEWLLSREYEE